MSWVLSLGKAVAKAIVPAAASRLLDRLLPVRRPRPEHVDDHEPFPLTHKDVDHIESQIRNATSPRAITHDHAAHGAKRGPHR
jgi:hypothetical protein